MESNRVLFVDKDKALFQDMAKRCVDDSMSFGHVSKSSEALRIIQGENIGLLVLDVGSCLMPIEEIIPIIRGINKDLPVIVTCKTNNPALERQIRAQNIFYYHIKGFGVSDLELAVKSALEKHNNKSSQIKEGE